MSEKAKQDIKETLDTRLEDTTAKIGGLTFGDKEDKEFTERLVGATGCGTVLVVMIAILLVGVLL